MLLLPNSQMGLRTKNPRTTLNLTGAVAAYFDANTETSLTLNNQSSFQSVSQFNDISENARHLAQATAANQPRLVRGIGNLANYSQSIDADYWLKVGAAVTPDSVIAPDGTMTGDTVTVTGGGSPYIQPLSALAVASGGTYTGSAYVKKGNTRWGQAQFYNSGIGRRVWFDLDTGTVGTNIAIGSGWALVGSSIESVGGGWWRISLSVVVTTSTVFNFCLSGFAVKGNGDTGGTLGGFTHIWGQMLNLGATANEYIGRNALATDGVNDFMNTASFLLPQPFSRFSVVTRRNSTAQGAILNSRLGIPDVALSCTTSTNIVQFGGANSVTSSNNFSAGQTRVFSEFFAGASSFIFNDGVGTAGNPGTNSMDGVNIGSLDSASLFSQNDIHSVLILNRLPNTIERQKLEVYFSRRYGSWRGLAQGNPYRYYDVQLVY